MVPATLNQPSVVRSATPADKAELWRLFRLLHEENGLSPMSDRKVDYYIDRLLNPANIKTDDNGPRGLVGVIGEPGRLEGAIMLSLGSMWYSDEITLDEYLNFVDPAHRNSDHAKTLIRYAKRIVDELRPAYPTLRLVIGILSTKRAGAKVRLYERQLTVCGAFFVYPPPENIDPPRNLYRMH
jgi:hypothetical protein